MTTLNLVITADIDDGYIEDPGTFSAGAAFDSFGVSAGGAARHTWLRYLNVTIPNGATINTAVVTGTCQTSLSGTTCRLKVCCANADNQGAVAVYADVTGITRTTGVTWTEGSETADSTYPTPDIASEVQTVVNRAGHASGDALMVIIDDNGSDTAARRAWYDFGITPLKATLFDITYTAGGGGGLPFFMQPEMLVGGKQHLGGMN